VHRPRALAAIVAASLVVVLGTVVVTPAGAATDPEEWGDAFCTETVDWLQGALDGAETLQQQALDPTITAAEGKDLIVEYLSTGVDATRAYARAVKQAGTPDIRNGAKIQAAILAGISGSLARLFALEKAAKALPTRSQAAFDKAAGKLGDRLGGFSSPFSRGMTKAGNLDKGTQLGGILQSLPACAPLLNASL
jgi:hypothetical protein